MMHWPDHRRKLDIVLIGRQLPDNENLGLGYLLAALQQAELHATMGVLNSWVDMAPLCKQVLELDPQVVGLSLPDGGSAVLLLAMGELLQQMGFRGHTTVGGGFATLARRWLLEQYPWLGSVVRFAGEVPLPRLVKAVKDGGRLDSIPGVTTRAGDGLPASVLDATQMEIRPVRDELSRIVGHRAAHMLATRGCTGRCHYCGPAALQRLERQEGLSGGYSPAELRCAGVGSVRRRSLSSVSEEMAALWHRRKVRYFYFVDEHLLPTEESEALQYLHTWKRELGRRGLHNPGIGCMLRADYVTPAIARAFADVGLARVFVGMELASCEELKRYGRKSDPAHGVNVLQTLEDLDVVTICNLMLVHPYSTVKALHNAIGFLEELGPIPFEATQMQVYQGTRLQRRLLDQGRLQGNPLLYAYTFDDPTVERFAQVFVRLRAEAFGDYSLGMRIHDLRLTIWLARRLLPHLPLCHWRSTCADLMQRLNALQTEAYRNALRLAEKGGGYGECEDLVLETRQAAEELEREIDQIASRVLERASARRGLFAPLKAAAAAAVFGVAVAGVSLVGEQSPQGHPIAKATRCSAPKKQALQRIVTKVASSLDLPCHDVGVRVASDGRRIHVSKRGSYCREDRRKCDAIQQAVVSQLKKQELAELAGCEATITGEQTRQSQTVETQVSKRCKDGKRVLDQVELHFDQDGRVTRVTVQRRGPTPPQVRCILKALEGLKFPCLRSRKACRQFVIME